MLRIVSVTGIIQNYIQICEYVGGKMKYFFALLLSGSITLALAACGTQSTPTPLPKPTVSPTQTGRAIVMGDISDDPAEVIEGAQPVADYLASQLADQGITSGQVRVATSTEEMIELLKKGEVDLYFDSTYPATLISDAGAGQIILRRWRFGVETYKSVIFASAESGITSVEQLPGHMIAMDAPYSTSGFLLPAVYLQEKGLTLAGKKDYNATVDSNEIGFAFSFDDENTLQWVLSGYTDAGVTDDFHFDVGFPKEATQKLVELARTESTPRQVVIARTGLDATLLEAIKRALTSMDDEGNTVGKAALESFQTSQFDEFPEGLQTATDRMRQMMKAVSNIPMP
jgi:phosphonate transport system substrate-binding protein